MLLRKLDRVMIRMISLQDNFARRFAASCASGNLRQQLKRALGGAKIRKSQRIIRSHNADQSYPVNIMPLSDHLCSDKKIYFSGMELVEHALKVMPIAHRIAVKPANARLRKRRVQPLFNFF